MPASSRRTFLCLVRSRTGGVRARSRAGGGRDFPARAGARRALPGEPRLRAGGGARAGTRASSGEMARRAIRARAPERAQVIRDALREGSAGSVLRTLGRLALALGRIQRELGDSGALASFEAYLVSGENRARSPSSKSAGRCYARRPAWAGFLPRGAGSDDVVAVSEYRADSFPLASEVELAASISGAAPRGPTCCGGSGSCGTGSSCAPKASAWPNTCGGLPWHAGTSSSRPMTERSVSTIGVGSSSATASRMTGRASRFPASRPTSPRGDTAGPATIW